MHFLSTLGFDGPKSVSKAKETVGGSLERRSMPEARWKTKIAKYVQYFHFSMSSEARKYPKAQYKPIINIIYTY